MMTNFRILFGFGQKFLFQLRPRFWFIFIFRFKVISLRLIFKPLNGWFLFTLAAYIFQEVHKDLTIQQTGSFVHNLSLHVGHNKRYVDVMELYSYFGRCYTLSSEMTYNIDLTIKHTLNLNRFVVNLYQISCFKPKCKEIF